VSAPWLVACLAVAPLSSAPPPAGLEGRTVTAVHVDAPPAEKARFTRYHELRVGEPLQAERVRHAVELLHATGRYADVVVEAEESAGGVALTFRLPPAPLLADVVVEGDRVRRPNRVRRLTRLRTGEPVWPTRLDRAAQQVALELAEDGYLEALVSAQARPSPRGADVVFTVRAGPQARVGRAQMEGLPPASADLDSRLAPRAGQVFRRGRSKRAAESVQEELRERGHWAARVSVDEAYDPRTARMDLTFRVEAGPRWRVAYEGDALPEPGLADDVRELVREGGTGADAVAEAAERIEDSFRRRGHRNARVTGHPNLREGEATLLFAVVAGAPSWVESVRLSGEAEAVAGLDALLVTRAAQPMQDALLEQDVTTLSRALEERGHAEARVEVEVPEGTGNLPVVFRILAGPRTTVATLEIATPVAVPQSGESRELRVRTGLPYRVRDLARDRQTLLAAFRDGGYPQVEVTPDVRFSEDRSQVDVVLRVTPGARVDVDHLVVAGLARTREDVVRRELLLKEGEPLGLQRVLESQRRLSALGIFQRVSVSELDPESPSRRSVLVVAEEAPLITVAYGIGYAERDLLRASAEVTRRNLFGMDRSLSTFARVSFRGSRLLTTYREPYFLGARQELFVTAFREEEDRPFFDFVRFGGFVQGARAVREDMSLIARYTYQLTDNFNIENPSQVGREFSSSTLSGPSFSIVNDTRDNPLDPRRGRFLSADLLLSLRVLGGNSFAKSYLQAGRYQRLTARTVVALSARLGLARTFGLEESIFLSEADRFYAGGPYSLRGFETDTVDPRGGNGLLLAGAELRQDVSRTFTLAAFTEAGNVYPLVSDMDLGNLRYVAGFGLRYRTAFGPLRVDWGFKLNRRPGESPSEVHLTVGHAF
jgi:outer membrane protein insertion porin family